MERDKRFLSIEKWHEESGDLKNPNAPGSSSLRTFHRQMSKPLGQQFGKYFFLSYADYHTLKRLYTQKEVQGKGRGRKRKVD